VFTGVSVDEIAMIWPVLEPMLRKAIASGETTDGLLSNLQSQEAQLWVVFDEGCPIAGIVTEIATEDDGSKVCNIWAVGGSAIQEWFGYLATIEAWARAEGCSAVTVDKGRPGWKRLMQGYKVTHVSLRKDI